MKIRAIRDRCSKCWGDSVAPFRPETEFDISIGSEYDVHAIVCFEGIFSFQIVDDVRCPGWYPSFLFEVTNRDCPKDWQCNLFSHTETVTIFVIGPSFVVESDDAYRSMMELEPDQVNRFWDRIDSQS